MLAVIQLYYWLHTTDCISFSFSAIFNSLLIFIVLTKSPKSLGVYKYLMAFISSFEILYSLMDLLIVPLHISYRTTVGVMVNISDRAFSYQTATYLNSIYWGFFGASMAIFGVHFIYRYLVVSGHNLLQTFNSWKFALWLSFPMLLGVVWALTGLWLCSPRPEFTEFIRSHVEGMFNESVEHFSYLGVYMWDYQDGAIHVFPGALPPMILMSVSIIGSFAIILYFGTKCYRSILNLTKNVSSKTRALQSQLFYALVIQTLIPSLLMHFPVGLKFAMAILDNGAGAYCSLVSMTIAIYPAIDPLPNFFIIGPYRRAIFGTIFRFAMVDLVGTPICRIFGESVVRYGVGYAILSYCGQNVSLYDTCFKIAENWCAH